MRSPLRLGFVLLLLVLLAQHALQARPVAADSAFTDIGAGLPGVYMGSVAWGDYDNDGRLDILLAGSDPAWHAISRVYRNNGDSTFTDIGAGLPGAR